MTHPLMFDDDDPALARIRAVALALPRSEEVVRFGRPWFKVAGKTFAVFGGGPKGVPHDEVRRDWARTLLVFPDPEEAVALAADPRFFVPAYFGPSGWLGLRLDGTPDWDETAELITDSFRAMAPKRVLQDWEKS